MVRIVGSMNFRPSLKTATLNESCLNLDNIWARNPVRCAMIRILNF